MSRGPVSRMWAAWSRWAFDPVDTAPMAAMRIAVGLLVLGWTVSLLPDAQAFLADDGLLPELPEVSGGAWVLGLGPPYLVLGVLLVASVALVLGWRTRVVSVVVAALVLAVQRRDPFVLNSGDLLLRELAVFVALMPAGQVWSLDARRRGTPGAWRAPWALRLVQFQVSVLYLSSVMAKLRGDSWNEGTAVGTALQLEDLQRFVVPEVLATSLLVSTVMTFGTLALEGALVVGVWLPRTRWWVLGAGVLMHLGIDLTLLVGWFSFAVLTAYLAFVPGETLRRVVTRVGSRVRPASARPQDVAITPGV